jgi:hypothetical protein
MRHDTARPTNTFSPRERHPLHKCRRARGARNSGLKIPAGWNSPALALREQARAAVLPLRYALGTIVAYGTKKRMCEPGLFLGTMYLPHIRYDEPEYC